MREYLIVDDNRSLADNLAEILSDAGGRVDVATLGADALRYAATKSYSVLISDVRMPAMGGAELVHRLRRIDPGLPAVMITAYANNEDLVAAWHEGLLAVLPKPVPIARLIELVSGARRDGLLLLVDEDVELSSKLADALREHGFSTVTSRSLVEAELACEIRPFAALLGAVVPGAGGASSMTSAQQQLRRLPSLLMSEYAPLVPADVRCEASLEPLRTKDLLAAIEELYRARSH